MVKMRSFVPLRLAQLLLSYHYHAVRIVFYNTV